jgi:hypothetical protein
MPAEGWLHVVVTPGKGDDFHCLYVTHDSYKLI